jgi:two-component system response regulator ResD
MEQLKILAADKDPDTRAQIKMYAAFEGMTADEAADGVAAIKLFRRNDYGVIVLDGGIGELDALSVCRQIRKSSEVPVIITSSGGEEDEILGYYEAGADDFLKKPYSGRMLMARINALLKRSRGKEDFVPRRIIYEGLCIDTVSRSVFIDGAPVSLSPKEYKLLLFLAKNPRKAMSRETILRNVWGEDFFGTDRTVDTHIKLLRGHIKPYDRMIGTVWGSGYIFR